MRLTPSSPSFPQVREIWLSSEDTGAYGRDIGTDIAALLRRMADALPRDGSVMLRLGMTNPPYMLQHLEAVAEVWCVVGEGRHDQSALHASAPGGSCRGV